MVSNTNNVKSLSVVPEQISPDSVSLPHQEAKPPGPDYDLDVSEWYLNRELTWLEFNRRVLHEAQDERTPLLERCKFVGIVSSNLDEFFMKRIGGLKQQQGAGVKELSIDGHWFHDSLNCLPKRISTSPPSIHWMMTLRQSFVITTLITSIHW